MRPPWARWLFNWLAMAMVAPMTFLLHNVGLCVNSMGATAMHCAMVEANRAGHWCTKVGQPNVAMLGLVVPRGLVAAPVRVQSIST